ncbi:tetratricopeptide repeat protein 31 [Rhynochetos jubatus]
MAARQPLPATCPTSGPVASYFRSRRTPFPRVRWRRRLVAMRGVDGARDPAGPGLGASRFGAAPVTCPWGCVLGPGGWSGAPFCPRHCLPAAAEDERSRRPAAFRPVNGSIVWEVSGSRDALGRVPGFCEDSDPPYNFCGLKKSLLRGEPPRAPPSALQMKLHRLPAPRGRQLTAEEAERNARELVAEEERAKRKAEKKKLKKKKQKDRKKREKLGEDPKNKQETESSASSRSGAAGAGHPRSGGAEEEGGGREAGAQEMEDELDLSCTFVSKAREKAGVRLPAPGKGKPARMDGTEPGRRAPGKVPEPCSPAPRTPEPAPLDITTVEQSLILAGRANAAAQKGRYAEAVQAFTEAVRLNPREYRLFGNRSYCYEKLGRYEEALRDAQVSLRLRPDWPKGFFRKGKALRGLQRYAEAASTFEELLLRADRADADAAAQLEACQALQRQSSPRSPGGVPPSPSLPEAGEPSRSGASGSCRDTSGFVTGVGTGSPAKGRAAAATHPPRDCYPLWVGNVTPRITKKVLHSCFSRFGEIRSIRMLPERRCAFLNYPQKAAAEAAYVAMRDAEVEGSRLVLQLKHPSHATPSPGHRLDPPHAMGLSPGGLL